MTDDENPLADGEDGPFSPGNADHGEGDPPTEDVLAALASSHADLAETVERLQATVERQQTVLADVLETVADGDVSEVHVREAYKMGAEKGGEHGAELGFKHGYRKGREDASGRDADTPTENDIGRGDRSPRGFQ
jgi:hypothetical protein